MRFDGPYFEVAKFWLDSHFSKVPDDIVVRKFPVLFLVGLSCFENASRLFSRKVVGVLHESVGQSFCFTSLGGDDRGSPLTNNGHSGGCDGL
jgi:hypothetical protein